MADILGGMNINVAAITQGIYTGATIVIVGLVCIAFLFVLRYLLKFKFSVTFLIKQNEGYSIKRDKGWLNQKKRNFKVLKNKDIMCPYPESNYIVPEGKKENLFGIVENNVCTWANITHGVGFVSADMNMMNWIADTYLSIDEATQNQLSFWDKYGHQIIWLGTIVIFMVCIILILKSVDRAIEMGSSVASSLSQSVQQTGTQIIQ